MRKQKVVIRKRHQQTPKALLSPTDHVTSGCCSHFWDAMYRIPRASLWLVIEVSKLHKRFGKDIAFIRQVIYGYLIDLVGSDEKEDIEDIVRLWILLLLSTFLAPQSAYVCSPQMIKYLDDIERIGSYAWVVAFHELILHNIEEASKMVKMNAKRGTHDEKPRKNQFIFGCSYALCVESKLPIHPSEQWVLEGQRGKTNSKDFALAEETSTLALSINAQMTALVDALKAAEESEETTTLKEELRCVKVLMLMAFIGEMTPVIGATSIAFEASPAEEASAASESAASEASPVGEASAASEASPVGKASAASEA
ncbi:hypothetical protein Taro_018992 [Colocasia esculenta]|uniref:Aminotransferase-like plant mobile domain-containing protein n=1 Tax=Colocasia esculenta TaxID=4460 RepID=A0A843V454_COLES|nr:hypothetical protein [Colocasia esculenta]